MKMKVKINKYIFSLFRPPFFGKTKRRLPGNSLPMSHNIFYSLPMRFLICDDVRLAHRRGESPHLRRRNMQAGCGGVTLGVERKVACPEQIVHRGPGLGRVPRDGLENIAALAVTLDMPLLAATLHHLQMLQLNVPCGDVSFSRLLRFSRMGGLSSRKGSRSPNTSFRI